jgi:hypothetical protein
LGERVGVRGRGKANFVVNQEIERVIE